MEASFWHEKWESNIIGFHESQANPLLVSYFNELSIDKNDRVFVPLCGKTLDIAWLLSQGCQVAGVELSQLAVEQLFEELGIGPVITDVGSLKLYSAPNLDIFMGDFFELTSAMLGTIDAVFDRAALVALPDDMRIRYSRHLTDITGNAVQLLITFEYDQSLMVGPPFSIGAEEVRRQYEACYNISPLVSVEVAGGLAGKCDATESVWLLKRA